MSRMFFPKLAASNLKKNSKVYAPFLLASIGITAMFFILRSLVYNSALQQDMRGMLSMGVGITAVFSFIFLFYTNSFLMKRRKKELGLYNILGMEKKHISIMLFFEILYLFILTLIFGILFGFLLSKVMFLILLKMMDMGVTMGFEFSFKALGYTVALFAVIFLGIYISSICRVHLSSPIELLRGGEVGEKEPKAKWLTAILGLICLGIGYYLAVTTQNPLSALTIFFVAVLFVVIGTYLLFMAGSIALLKILKKNKKYYYKTRHFISISSMFYRMKQNAVGLANICILSTAVLVMVSSTLSLWMGMEDVLNTRYPNEYVLCLSDPNKEKIDSMHQSVDRMLQEYDLEQTRKVEYQVLSFVILEQDDVFSMDQENMGNFSLDNLRNLFVIPLSDYNRQTGEAVTLEENEVLFYDNRIEYDYDSFHLGEKEFQIKQRLSAFPGNGFMAANIASSHFIVVKDESVIHSIYEIQKEAYGKMASEIEQYYGFDVNTNDHDKLIGGYSMLSSSLPDTCYLESREAEKQGFISVYGSLFFLGIFLGVLFLTATALIIYYKQVTEGYDDRSRYEIMQKVGLERKEIKASIRSQILTVFFLPLVMAVVHICFAFPVIEKLLAIFSMTNRNLYLLCTGACVLVFIIIYVVIYSLTSKVYYSLSVNRENRREA